MTNIRSRGWCFTLNNYNDFELLQIQDRCSSADYGIVGLEVGESGTPHLQGYLYFEDAKSFKTIKKYLGDRAHIEKAKGTPTENRNYCMKEGQYNEYGNVPKGQGNRSDLDEIKEVLKQTNKMRNVVEVAKSYQSVKMAEQYLKYHEKPRDFKPRVEWYWGATGTGKSKTAYEELGEDVYTCLSTARWFDGYDAHENVLIDDMRKDFCKFHELLRMLDRYAFKVETKGGTRQFLAKRIIITSCYPPQELFNTREDINQLLRRIDVIKNFNA